MSATPNDAAAAKVRSGRTTPKGGAKVNLGDIGDDSFEGPSAPSSPAASCSATRLQQHCGGSGVQRSPSTLSRPVPQPLADLTHSCAATMPRSLSRTATTGDLHFKLYLPELGPEGTLEPGSKVVLKTPTKTQRLTKFPGNASSHAKVVCRPWSPSSYQPSSIENKGYVGAFSGDQAGVSAAYGMSNFRGGGWKTSPHAWLEKYVDAPPPDEGTTRPDIFQAAFLNDVSSRPPNQSLGSRAPGHWKRTLHRPKVLIARGPTGLKDTFAELPAQPVKRDNFQLRQVHNLAASQCLVQQRAESNILGKLVANDS